MYNNPYLYQSLYKPGLFSRLFGGIGAGAGALKNGINWGTILNNTQKSLGIINQAIPLVYQVKPIVNNAKTMFKIADALKGDNKTTKNSSVNTTTVSTSQNTNKPIFYM